MRRSERKGATVGRTSEQTYAVKEWKGGKSVDGWMMDGRESQFESGTRVSFWKEWSRVAKKGETGRKFTSSTTKAQHAAGPWHV